ncbi:zinc-ribbon domain-containing protein [Streptomyces sp. NPDC048279]|uniref:zinc-ribbon domain-containing protein n=1 Tax=Streptomyces sp. NPDC048279 TaxID=3154714 RepID=UPI003438755D
MAFLDAWPPQPQPLDTGSRGREDRLRMLRQMRSVWEENNRARHERIKKELEVAKARQAEVTAYWNQHKTTVVGRWDSRTGGRGETTIADIPEVAAQWHEDNRVHPENLSATAQRRGEVSPYMWQCPLAFGHEPWPAWPKDRIQKGAGCPECRRLTRLADLPALAAQYRGQIPASDITHASHESVPWACRTWSVDPSTGVWRPVEHRFGAVVKERALQGNGCLVCAGYVIDDTNSLLTWFPEIADELDAPDLDPRWLPTSQHNISRKDAAGAGSAGTYATLSWRCRHGHVWEATILNRVQGTGCGKCSTSGISKEQVRLVAELSGLIDLVPPTSRDPRLPDGVPDFASHRLTVPPEHKPAHWRYKDVEVDAVFQLPHGVRVGLEYDGAFHHSARQRERRQYENDKSRVLVEAGILDLLIHVRIGDLPEMEAPHALVVAVPERATAYQQASAVALALSAHFPKATLALDAYLNGGTARHEAAADAYITAVWGELRPPRRKPKKAAPPTPRRLSPTAPHADSLLSPVSEPYRNPENPDEIVRDYRCGCGNPEIITSVQSQVTSGNTRSCGCLATQTRQRPRPAISKTETHAVRAWAQQRAIVIGGSGRVPDRVTASFRLDQAGRGDLLGPDGLLDEACVREWAVSVGRQLGARGRVTGELWLDYSSKEIAAGSQIKEIPDLLVGR